MRQNQRAVFYSHDTLGLGHLRRTLLISRELETRFRDLSTLIITGSAMAHGFRIPDGVDYIKLPSVRKVDNEIYQSRFLSLPFEQIFGLREEIVFQTVVNYRPEFFFVDNVPLGMKGELQRTLRYIRDRLPHTRVILNLRDIVDSANHVVPLWRRLGVFEALESFYDRIFIYGQPSVFDPVIEYAFPGSLRDKSRFCGYIPRAADQQSSNRVRRQLGLKEDEKFVLVTVGGGSDGALIVENYLRALPLVAQKGLVVSVVLLGPEMHQREVQRFASEPSELPVRLIEFCDDPLTYMGAADVVVSMAGYNTVSEIVGLGKRAVVIPRVHPRQEQLIRSQRFQELGLLRMIHPAFLTPQRLAEEIEAALDCADPPPKSNLDFGGMRRMSSEIHTLLQERTPLFRAVIPAEAVG